MIKEKGPSAIENGYLIVPIAEKQKRPMVSGWPNLRLTAQDCDKYGSQSGVGILCGQGENPIVAIDIDIVTHPDLVNSFADTVEVMYGCAMRRVGRAPKLLMVYRADKAGIGKRQSRQYVDDQKLEILGAGQQFVAYGIHPATGKPYTWEELIYGDPCSMKACELPVLTETDLKNIIHMFEEMAAKHGLQPLEGSTLQTSSSSNLSDPDDPFRGLAQRDENYTLDDYRKDLAALGTDGADDYDTWIKVGQVGHHQFEASEEAFQIWHEWSATSSNYSSEADCEHKWKTFGKTGRNPVTIGTLIKLVRDKRKVEETALKRTNREWAVQQVESCMDSVALTTTLAKDIGVRIGSDKAGRDLLVSKIQKRFKELEGESIRSSSVLAALEPPATFKRKYQLTQEGNAERLVDRIAGSFIYMAFDKSWYQYEDGVWFKRSQKYMKDMARDIVKDFLDEIAQSKDDDRYVKALYEHYRESQNIRMYSAMEEIASCDKERILHDKLEFNANKDLLCFNNGVYKISTDELLPHSPDYFFSVKIPCDYNPQAQCPLFQQTLLDVFNGDTAMVEYFKQVIGYALSGKANRAKMFLLYGDGANGKSTIVNTISKAFGPLALTAAADTFTVSGKGATGNGGGAREDLTRLQYARLVLVSETEEGSFLRESTVKTMTGGDTITARANYAPESISYTASFVPVMCTNHIPKIRGTDRGIWRRLKLIPFTRNFENDPTVKDDPNRSEKLAAELEGIMAWCIEGLRLFMKYKLADDMEPEGVTMAVQEYRDEQDPLTDFIAECCELGDGFGASTNDLYTAWNAFATPRGEAHFVKSARSMGMRMSRKGFRGVQDKEGVEGRGFVGIRLKTTNPIF